MSNVNTNWITFEQGVERIRRAVGKDFDQQSRIITSRDADVGKLQTKLKVGGVPDGFEKWSCRFTSVAPRSYLFPLPHPMPRSESTPTTREMASASWWAALSTMPARN